MQESQKTCRIISMLFAFGGKARVKRLVFAM
jgi:hypothetical protein